MTPDSALRYGALLPVTAAAYVSFLAAPRLIGLRDVRLLLLATGLVLVSLLRAGRLGDAISMDGAIRETTRWVWFTTAIVIIILSPAAREHRERYVRAIVAAPLVYVATSVGLYLGGFQNPAAQAYSQTHASMLALFGVNTPRVVLPLATGLDNFGAMAGIALAAGLSRALSGTSTRRRLAALAAAAPAVAALLLCDARAALVIGIAAPLVVRVAPAIGPRIAFVAIPASSVVVLALVASLSTFAFTAKLSRSDTATFSSATQRDVVWDSARRVVTHPDVATVLGYGAFGQQTSGLSAGYAYIFRGENGYLKSAHNFALQMILDIGLVGLVLFLVVWWRCLISLFRIRELSSYAAPLSAMFFALFAVGFTEAIPSLYCPESFAMWLLLCIVVLPRTLWSAR